MKQSGVTNGFTLFVNTLSDDDIHLITYKYKNKYIYISCFEFYDNGILLKNSLTEKIYSNGTAYHINGEFIGYAGYENDTVMNITKYINTKIFNEKVYPFLIEFIEQEDCNCIVVPKYNDLVKIAIDDCTESDNGTNDE